MSSGKNMSQFACLTSHRKSTESDTETTPLTVIYAWHQLSVKSIQVLTFFFSFFFLNQVWEVKIKQSERETQSSEGKKRVDEEEINKGQGKSGTYRLKFLFQAHGGIL